MLFRSKQSGKYDDIVDEALLKYPPPVTDQPAKGKDIIKAPPKQRRPRILDERTANVFPNDHQFHAFRDAVTTQAAQKIIPVDQQLALAKKIMKTPAGKASSEKGEFGGATTKKQIGAPYITKMVQAEVQQGLKEQRDIDKKERQLYELEQREARIDKELYTAKASLRSLNSAIAKLIDLADEFPGHAKIGGFSAQLDQLVDAIKQLSKKLK